MPVYLILAADGRLLGGTSISFAEADHLRRLLGGDTVEVRWER